MADDRYFWAKTRRNYDFEKRRYATLCFPFGFFYEIAIVRERIFVRNSYPSPCGPMSVFTGIGQTLMSRPVWYTHLVVQICKNIDIFLPFTASIRKIIPTSTSNWPSKKRLIFWTFFLIVFISNLCTIFITLFLWNYWKILTIF